MRRARGPPLSHTGAMVGADDVFDAARAARRRRARRQRRPAVCRGRRRSPRTFRPRGNRLAMITNGGGPGVMAADRAADLGIPLAAACPTQRWRRSTRRCRQLVARQPDRHRSATPTPARYRAALAACLDDQQCRRRAGDPHAAGDDRRRRRSRAAVDRGRAARSDKPLIACWMGEEQVREARQLLHEALASRPSARRSRRSSCFAHISAYYRNQQLLLQTPRSLTAPGRRPTSKARGW